VSEGAAKKEQKPRKFQAIRGTRDLLPPETALWSHVEQTAHEVFATFGFGEIRLPIFEPTELFARSIGLDTDIVAKEMFSFEDYEPSSVLEYRSAIITWQEPRDVQGPPGPLGTGALAKFQPFSALLSSFYLAGREAFEKRLIPRTPENGSLLNELVGERDIFLSSIQSRNDRENRADVDRLKERVRRLQLGDELTLRPEATASVCRAYIEHGMQQLPQPVKLYYMGPMFRRERPQKGRYRQFYQIGAEVLGGSDAPAIDAEVIEMVMTFFDRLELQGVQLDINSIGHSADNCRRGYVEKLKAALDKVKDKLGPDSQRRIETNPLRVLDSKLESEQPIIAKLPRIADHLCHDCATHYMAVKRELDLRSVKYRENWRLVRGLDYYMRTTFEIIAKGLGSQDAVCGGGRYDGLVELLGGPPTKGIGFAIGEDRLILSLIHAKRLPQRRGIDVVLAWMTPDAYSKAVELARQLRGEGIKVELPVKLMRAGDAVRYADRIGAFFTLMVGEDELRSGKLTLKHMMRQEQIKISETALVDHLRHRNELQEGPERK